MRPYLYLTIVRIPDKEPLYYYGSKKPDSKDTLLPDGRVKGYYGSSPYILALLDSGHEDWLQCRLLSYSNTNILRSESALILKGLYKHGAYFYDSMYWDSRTSKSKRRSWLDQFGPGTCLNCHWNDCSHAAMASKESRRDNGVTSRFVYSNRNKQPLAVEAARSQVKEFGFTESHKESVRKNVRIAIAARHQNGCKGIAISPENKRYGPGTCTELESLTGIPFGSAGVFIHKAHQFGVWKPSRGAYKNWIFYPYE